MQQIKSENRQLTYWENLYHHYRQYVEFLNDFIVTKPYTQVLLIIPNVIMISDVILHVGHWPTGHDSDAEISRVLHSLSYIGVSQALVELFYTSQLLLYSILCLMLIFLLSPVFIVLQIFIITALESSHKKQIGYYRRIYQASIIHKIIRVFIFMFQYIMMPIITSIGIKIIIPDENFGTPTLIMIGTVILVLIPFVYLIAEYHLLQIIDQNDRLQKQSLVLSRVNFPNNCIDAALIYLYCILVNYLEDSWPLIMSTSIFVCRILVAAYFKYYQSGVLRQQYYTLVSSLIILIGLFIIFVCREMYIVMLSIVVLLILVKLIKNKILLQNKSQYEIVQKQQNSIQQLKKELWRKGTFTHVFRQLIFHSRKNYTHRQQLLIEILKVKCYELEAKSRGGAKMSNTQDLLKFENLFVAFLGNMLLIGDNSISILRLLQNKEPKRQIFAHQVKLLVNKINQNKEIISRMRQINDISFQGIVLMKIMFNEFYNDLQFVKQMDQKSRIHIASLAQKQVKTRLFNKKTTAIFINILDEPGKIVRVSKNLPAVLGHSATDLVGKSINQIIPFTIQPYHDQNLIKFVDIYSKKTMRSDPKIQFFAYNKDFHLQQCVIRYNFVMSYFGSFQLSGVMRKIQEENKNVILMNEDGILQGWTQELGTVFNFDQFEMGECLKFNIMALFPSLIKYSQVASTSIKTVFFRAGKVKQKALQITEYRNLKGKELHQKQIDTFKNLLQNDELIEAYLGDIEFQNISFCSNKAKIKKIQIKNFERIQNFNEIQDSIIKTLNGQKGQENQQQQIDEKSMSKQVSMSQYSMIGDQAQGNKAIDSNFTLDHSRPNSFKKQEIRLQSQVSKSQLSIQLTDANHMEEDHLINDQINANAAEQGNDSLIEAQFSPKLQTQTNFIPFLIFIALSFIAIITWDQVVLSQTQTLMKQQCQNVINRNRALMIYAKSTFNPNATYIREFDNANLMQVSAFLGQQQFDYKTYLGDIIKQNKFYMFNIQIPSTLDRILMASTQQKRTAYQKEVQYNFNAIMQAWMQRFDQSRSEWSKTIGKVKTDFTIRLIIISIGSIAFSLFLIYIYMQYRKQKKMTQAFFKFQKVDLDQKMTAIRRVIKNVQIKAVQWHLDKQFYEFIKKKEITNLQFEMQASPCQTKIKFETSEQAEQKLAKKKLYSVLFFIVIFLLTQILFIILYSVLNFQQIKSFETVPEQLNKACKLVVLPNLMLANMFYQVPPTMISDYKTVQTQVLQKPLDSVPNLFNLLQDAPCIDCKFMYPLLTTNFRSFYSTFEQVITSKTLNHDSNITELYYAVDVVVDRVTSALTTKSLLFLPATIFLYIFSLTVFFLSIYFNIRKMIQQNEKLEVFLKYFDEQILVKNKHMNGLFNKNT